MTKRVAAVDGRRRCAVTEDIRRAPQQGSHPATTLPYMCLTSVFGMVASLSAASGRFSEGAASAAVDEGRRPYGRRTFVGNRNWKQVDPHPPAQRYKKTSALLDGGYNMFALPIFTASHPATIVGVHVLNFCVRDGNRWTHMTINTNLLTW